MLHLRTKTPSPRHDKSEEWSSNISVRMIRKLHNERLRLRRFIAPFLTRKACDICVYRYHYAFPVQSVRLSGWSLIFVITLRPFVIRDHHVCTRMTRKPRSWERQVSHPPCARPLLPSTTADEDDVPRPEFRSCQPAADWRRCWWSSRKWGVAISWSVCPVASDPRSAWKCNWWIPSPCILPRRPVALARTL